MKLVILESPNKTKTISQYLGKDYKVLSSNGHITKLALTNKYKMGIDLDNFEPEFIVDERKKAILQNLKKNAKLSSEIYLATDPDREGEAIAFHLFNNIKNSSAKKFKRIIFNEVTKKAVLKSLENPTDINLPLVESQITRRMLDRMFGFRLSNLLKKKINCKSAGRVQSVALKIIIEREVEIKKHVPETLYTIFGNYQNKAKVLLKKQLSKNKETEIKIKNKQIIFKDKSKFDSWFQKLESNLKVTNVKEGEEIIKTPSPLTTAKLIQLVSSKFNYSIKKTMFIVQKLYEGIEINNKLVGLISYPRTDSTRLNQDFIEQTKEKIIETYGSEFVLQKNEVQKVDRTKSNLNVQDAHEAIRITWQLSLEEAKEVLEPQYFNIYRLIYFYSLAPLMSEGKIFKKVFQLENDDYQFELISKKLIFPGFTKVLKEFLQTKLAIFENQTDFFPIWKENDLVKLDNFICKTKITEPKPRLTEGKLIKSLENLGIGRPSTYNTIIDKLIDNQYLLKENNKLFPTEKGFEVELNLEKYFSEFVNKKYTADLEKELDDIVISKLSRTEFLKKFWNKFTIKLKIGEKNMKKEKACPKCQKELIVKRGKFGFFTTCSGYPECRYIEKDQKESKILDKKCPKCEKNLIEKFGKFGKFNACSGYPECRYIEKEERKTKILDKKCPNCEKALIEKFGKFGKFNACSGYPECRYIEKKEYQKGTMLEEKCSKCNSKLMKKNGRFGSFIACSNYPTCKNIIKSDKKNSKSETEKKS